MVDKSVIIVIEVKMDFIIRLLMFVGGGLLIAFSIILGLALTIGLPFIAIATGSLAPIVIWGVIDLVIFLVGAFLVRAAAGS